MKALRVLGKRVVSILLVFSLLFSLIPIQSFAKTAYDPKDDFKQLQLRFWEDQQPTVGFYINASSRYVLETVTEPKMGSTFGEWSVMDLLRGMYTGYDYMNYIPKDYFDNYLQGIEGYVIGKEGNLDRNKSTEWSRLILTLSSLGYDITKVGSPGDYFKTYSTVNTGIVDAIKVEEDNLIKIDRVVKIYDSNRKYIEIPAGTYTGDVVANTITDSNGTVYTLNANQFLSIEEGYDFIGRLSESYKFSYRQGINGPIWETIAMNTGGYKFYEDSNNADANTFGKMIGFILNKEITQTDGTVGGWALTGDIPDPDITGMALQALAPYYLDRSKYEAEQVQLVDNKGNKLKDYSYEEFAQAVERAIFVLSLIQDKNGGFNSWGTRNSESIVQVIVALTELNIDPLQENIELRHIGKTIDFITEGQEHEGVFTNNMIDALLTFWANGSGSSPEVGGFKHVTTGYDGGGGSGTGVNAMATDQALYGLIAYDRFKKGEKKLYDMTDMTSGQYKNMKAKTYEVNYVGDKDFTIKTESYSPYATIKIPEGSSVSLRTFIGWNTAEDGSGVKYESGELLSMPEQNITLYAQYEADVEKIIEAIDALPEVADLKLSDQQAIEEVRQVYDDLTSEQQKLITNQSKLVNLELKMVELKQVETDTDAAKQVIEAINNLPKEKDLTLEDKQVIEEIRSTFNSLTETQKALVTNYADFEALEQKLAELLANEEDMKKVQIVIDELSGLPKLEDLKLEHKATVDHARKSYDALTQDQKALVTNYVNLEALEQKLAELLVDEEGKGKAQKVIDEIGSLPKLEDLKLEHKTTVDQARKSYDGLTQMQKTLVTNYVNLEALEQELAELLVDEEGKGKAQKVIDEIRALPKLADLKLENKEIVDQVRKSYDALTQDQKALVTNVADLTALEKKLTDLSVAEVDKTVAEKVTKEINNLPEVKDLTLINRKAVEDARKSFNSLTTEQQKLVTNQSKLVTLEAKLAELTQSETNKAAAEKVIDVINNLPTVSKLTLEDEKAVEKARQAYKSLTAAQQQLVTNYQDLIELEEKIEELTIEVVNEDDSNDNSSGNIVGSDVNNNGSLYSAESSDTLENSNGRNSDSFENKGVQGSQGSQSQSGSLLPNTATNNFNLLLVGFVLMMIGGFIYFYSRKKSI